MTRSDALNSPHHPLMLSWLILFIIIILGELFVLFLFYVTKLTPVLSKQCIYRLWDLIVNVDSNKTLSPSLVIKYFPYIPFYPLFTYSEWNFISYCSFSAVQISSWAQSLFKEIEFQFQLWPFCVRLHALLVLTVHGFSPGIPVSLKSLKHMLNSLFFFKESWMRTAGPYWFKGFPKHGFLHTSDSLKSLTFQSNKQLLDFCLQNAGG